MPHMDKKILCLIISCFISGNLHIHIFDFYFDLFHEICLTLKDQIYFTEFGFGKRSIVIFSAITSLAFRFARSNSIFLGLWFGYSKPDFLTFLQPFSKEFQDIYSKGIFILY